MQVQIRIIEVSDKRGSDNGGSTVSLNCTHEIFRTIYYSLITAPVTKQGESPLAVAVRERNLDMIKCLVNECNANVNGESSV